MKKLVLCLLMVICLFGCSAKNEDVEQEGETVYKIGICNYVDDAIRLSLSQQIAVYHFIRTAHHSAWRVPSEQ